MYALPAELRHALTEELDSHREHDLAASAAELTARYHRPIDRPALRSATDVAAYAAVRMPATFAAVRSALGQAAAVAPGFRPRTHLDVGGGTGAAVWAAADCWPDLAEVTVLERDRAAAGLGRALAARSPHPGVRRAAWRQADLAKDVTTEPADLVTVSYVLGELPEAARLPLVRRLAGRAGMLAVVEPGSPEGYERVLAARDLLVELGMNIAAPCPHDGACPLGPGDWCHFAARLPRESLHRRLKAGSLGFEDEKFSYVVATTDPVTPPGARVLRHPRTRKGLVTLTLCGEGVGDRNVSKRDGELYRAARDTAWGEAWPPV
ncbi:small ribosomal subunit Rsm22 family protein [Nonomuraea sp. NPDC050790]|uniref:small ribosomal subunit Rsm22 family protein n=1 Tax=Nonomuraea sp. NPDC050790 TaxID=3364371 RepID=UPI0037AC8CBA